MSSFPQPRELSPEELKEAYALSMGAFTAEDLQRFTELDSGVPALDVLREAEEEMDKHDEQCG
ncbi:MAG: hypothetical protein FJ271_01260 [Planctomycetes bacterium]|nr:hypothetical protein [Planctomycetota bacterium]